MRARSQAQENLAAAVSLRDAADELEVMVEMAREDESGADEELAKALNRIGPELDRFELTNKMGGEHDKSNAFLEIHPGAGGTESQDWAEMLERLYLRWCERRGFDVELIDEQPGDEAGIKSATLLVKGPYAYGNLKSENGIHRLVRISPFDAQNRRHTSFASAHVYPEIDDEVDMEIEEKDLRVDRFCSSGPGGQGGQHHLFGGAGGPYSHRDHRHLPERAVADQESRQRDEGPQGAPVRARNGPARGGDGQAANGPKKEISWGHQIRSYALQPYRMVKDLRTGHEVGNADRVLDGDIDDFIEAFLHWAGAGNRHRVTFNLRLSTRASRNLYFCTP